MGKSRRGAKELGREQKLIHENKRLKRELAQLRKQMARIDLDRFETLREMIEENQTEEHSEFGADFLENLKKTWLCNDCRNGYLEIVIYSRRDGTYYYRACNNCEKRTKSQAYAETIKGIRRPKEKSE